MPFLVFIKQVAGGKNEKKGVANYRFSVCFAIGFNWRKRMRRRTSAR